MNNFIFEFLLMLPVWGLLLLGYLAGRALEFSITWCLKNISVTKKP